MRCVAVALLVMGSGLAGVAQARYWEEECFNVVTHDAKMRKYEYKYMWGSSDTLTKGQEGSSHVTSQNSTQTSTAGIDPGYTTGRSRSYGMFTSSKKPCAFTQNRERRDRFVAANSDQIKRDVARGEGVHLRTFAVLSGCTDAVMPQFYAASRSHFDAIEAVGPEDGGLSAAIDGVIAGDQVLAVGCTGT